MNWLAARTCIRQNATEFWNSVIVFRETVKLSTIWVAFKYDHHIDTFQKSWVECWSRNRLRFSITWLAARTCIRQNATEFWHSVIVFRETVKFSTIWAANTDDRLNKLIQKSWVECWSRVWVKFSMNWLAARTCIRQNATEFWHSVIVFRETVKFSTISAANTSGRLNNLIQKSWVEC